MKQTSNKTIHSRNRLLASAGLVVSIIGLSLAIALWPGKAKDQKQNTAQNQQTVQKGKKSNAQRKAAKRRRPIPNPMAYKSKKPNINLEDDEYADLTPEMRSILTQLQEALDNDNATGVSSVCAKIQKIIQERGEKAVPVVVRENAVEALGLSLPHSLPELMGFMADGNADVRDAVQEGLEDLFNDPTVGDRNLGPILTSLGKVVTDEDLIETMITSLESDLRNSIMVETYTQILKTGTEEMKQKVRESIDELLDVDDEEVTLTDSQRVEGLEKFLKEEPDDEEDDDFYGADKDDDDN